ncbi:MAG: winged helix DNA-binding domain-containing protein [Chloroflexi bacterium]|nr:winged helix DNA-binding domain-containing protein [Chloroflexota bacterium]
MTGDAARRYLLGRQGLWPGRRWSGKEGAATAIRALESVQMDSVTVVARNHDLILWSRVDRYDPAHLDELIHSERRFFDYGGHLDIYPMEELPTWRLHMRRRGDDTRWAAFASEHPELLEMVRKQVRTRGPLGVRDLEGAARVASYRGGKDTSLALYYLWLTGEFMTHSRRGFERRYDLSERIAPPDQDSEASEAETQQHFAAKALRQLGLGTLSAWAGAVGYGLHQRWDRTETRARLDRLITQGEAAAATVAGGKEVYYFPAADLPLIDDLEAGRTPDAWRPVATTTTEEVTLLAPLDNLLARERTQALFEFEYLWEIYKPAHVRRWGRYTLPILYGDRLVARIEPRLDRKARTLSVDGFWLEDDATGADPAFATALARGLARFARFHNGARLNLSGLEPTTLRHRMEAAGEG